MRGEVSRGPTGLVAIRSNSTWYYVMKDHLGSTKLIVNTSSVPVARYEYDPYGKVMDSYVNLSQGGYGFTGQEKESWTVSLWNFRAREFDSEIGQFLAVDPAHQGYTSYGYVQGNPVTNVDPTGRRIGRGRNLYEMVFKIVIDRIAATEEIVNDDQRKLDEAMASDDQAAVIAAQTKLDEDKKDLSEQQTYAEGLVNVLSSEVTFNIDIGKTKDTNPGQIVRDAATGEINITIDPKKNLAEGKEGRLGDIAHELEHGIQYLQGRMSFREGKGGWLYDRYDELEAVNTKMMIMKMPKSQYFTIDNLTDPRNFPKYKKCNKDDRTLDSQSPDPSYPTYRDYLRQWNFQRRPDVHEYYYDGGER